MQGWQRWWMQTLILVGIVGCSDDSNTPRVAVAYVDVTGPSTVILVADTTRLTATTQNAEGNALGGRRVTWESSDLQVATVSSTGLVTGVATGPVVITATSEGKQGEMALTVEAPPAAPTGLAAWPGPGYGEITLRWPQVGNIGEYVLYWQTTPGVTPATGTRVPLNGLEFHHTGLTPGTTYYYIIITVTHGEGAPSAEVHATASDQLGLNHHQPTAGKLVANQLFVSAQVTSKFQIASVVAVVADRSANLAFDPNAVLDSVSGTGPPVRGPGWVGSVPLTGLPRGPLTVVVTATDVNAASVSSAVAIVLDAPPVLTILSPLEASVAHPSLSVTAVCEDDDPAGCGSLVMSGPSGVVSLPSGQAVDVNFPPAPDGVTLQFTATDRAGQVTKGTRNIYAIDGAGLTEIASTSGTIYDIAPDRLLYLDESVSPKTFSIRQLPAGPDQEIVDNASAPSSAHLIPGGAIVEFGNGISQWVQGTLTREAGASLVVNGNHAVWNVNQDLMRRDLQTGETIKVTAIAGNNSNGVGPNGDVAFWTVAPSQIWRYRNGTSTQLTADTLINVWPVTDGANVVYQKASTCCGSQQYQLAVTDATGEHILTPFHPLQRFPGFDYRAENGWVAFTRPGTADEQQVWRRDPAGQEQQVTQFSQTSHLEALGTAGELVVATSGGQRYLSVPGAALRPLGSAVGRPFLRDGAVYLAIGRSLFGVAP